MKGNLVERMEDWKWSSLQEYLGKSDEKICDIDLAFNHLDLRMESLLNDSYAVIAEDVIRNFY